MIKRLFLAWVLVLLAAPAWAQNVTCATRPTTDSSNACASTAFVKNVVTGIVPTTAGANTVFSGPTTGAAAAPAFRALVPADIPTGIPAANSTYTQSGTGGVAQTLQARNAQALPTPYDFGAVGTDTSADNTPMHNFFALLASGGAVRLPCGVWQITAQVTIALANGAHADIIGDGSDCAIIHVVGAINGIAVDYGNQWSSVTGSGFTITSDQTTGGFNCLTIAGAFTNPPSAYAATSVLRDITFRGANAYGAATQRCGTGLRIDTISNVNIDSFTFQGVGTFDGTAIHVVGSGTGGTYAVQINVLNSVINNCNVGINYDDWVQGIFLVNTNIVGCNTGITVKSSPVGILDQILASNSQFNTFICAICVNDAAFNNLQLMNNSFIINNNSKGIVVAGTNFVLTGNQVSGTSTTGTTGIEVASAFGNGGIISGNLVLNLATGIKFDAAVAAVVAVNENQFQINTADYSTNAAAVGVRIQDVIPRNYAAIAAQFPCNSATIYSSATIADSPTSTFYTNIAVGGGGFFGRLMCDGTNWQFH